MDFGESTPMRPLGSWNPVGITLRLNMTLDRGIGFGYGY